VNEKIGESYLKDFVSVEEMRWKVQEYACDLLLGEHFLCFRDNIPQHETFQKSVSLVTGRQKVENSCVTFKEFTVYSNSPAH